MKIALHNIRESLDSVFLDVDVVIESRVTAICGPSGAGKTTLLDIIAGLRRPASAIIALDERVLTDTAAGIHVPPRLRKIGYVPQDLALFPHLSVKGNLRYGHRPSMETGREGLFSYDHVIDVLEIKPLASRRIVHLSGGEKQRVALGRALLSSPDLLLLDEPLANLDARLKARIVPYLLRVRDEFRLPMLYVTHDTSEVSALCEEVLFIENGRAVRRPS